MKDEPGQNYYLLLSACPTIEEAKRIAAIIVADRLAACVNIIPQVASLYIWENKLQEEAECLMVIKTNQDCLSRLEAKILALHPYQIPECIALPLSGGNSAYLNWIDEILTI